MDAKKIAMGLMTAALLVCASAASAFDTNDRYIICSTKTDPVLSIQQKINSSDLSNANIKCFNDSYGDVNTFGRYNSGHSETDSASWQRSFSTNQRAATYVTETGLLDANISFLGSDYKVPRNRQDQIGSNTAFPTTSRVTLVPETSTLVGFGAALALNGIGVVGSGYYLRKRYNQASASRHISKMALYLDTVVSMMVLLTVSPILVALAASGAFQTEKPIVFRGKIKY